jgi:peptidoglycan/LPS O-acetylase OafA/YrhL
MDYRREIDGIRAIAVVPVILFHAGFERFSGGYVGVDVFFVISGYLITSIIIGDLDTGKFSLVGFYERRVRRILPALFFVLLACLPFAWFWLSPDDLKRFSEDLAAVSVFASNIEFWREANYFDGPAALKPLLHTWSLAVEEQYYVLFPILLIACWRFGTRALFGLMIVLAVASLAVAQWASIRHPAFAFYFLPTRGWELLIGAIAALYHFVSPEKKTAPAEPAVAELAGFAGLVLIAYAVFAFDSNTPFPGVYALAPTVGTVLLILFATTKNMVGRLLGHPILVGIGLISYSAYLWHQPLFAFARLHSAEDPGPWTFAFLSLAALALAYLTWRFVERPFRDRRRTARRTVFSSAAVLTFAMFGLGVVGYLKNGFPERMSPDDLEVLSYIPYDIDRIYRRGACLLDPEKTSADFSPVCATVPSPNNAVLLWGDSYAGAFSFGLRAVLPGAVIQYTSSACPPVIDLPIPTRPNCQEVNAFILKEAGRVHPAVVVLNANWNVHSQAVLDQLPKTIAAIKQAAPGSKVVIVGNVPRWEPSLPIKMLQKQVHLHSVLSLDAPLLPGLYANDAKLRAVAETTGASFVSALDALCDKGKGSCLATAQLPDGKFQPITWDVGHLTEAGSSLLANKLLPSIAPQAKP